MAEPQTLVAELWYAIAPDLTDPALLAGLRTISPATEVQQDSLAVPFGGADQGGPRPLLTVVLPGSPLGVDDKSLPDVSQTWDWAAEEALREARASVLVTEMFADAHPAADRVAALTGVVAALVAGTAPLAVSWPTSQRVSDPAAPAAGGLDGLLNVRLFSVSATGEEQVMDTLGLAPFGLPDVQCHFRGLDPGELAGVLFSTATYVFEDGDVISDGDTISGPQGDEHWVCRHEDALVALPRTVIDIDPGEPFAAGRRDR